MTESQPPQPRPTVDESVSRHYFDLLSVFHAESQADLERLDMIHHLAELDLEIPDTNKPDLPPAA